MTKATITDHQIRTLRSEAGAAGDIDQVRLCNEALYGNDLAREKCADAIKAAADAGTDKAAKAAKPTWFIPC